MASQLGISQNTYSKWESGQVKLKADIFPKLAEIYKVELLELLQHFFSENRNLSFYENKQESGNMAIDCASEKLIKNLQSQITHLQGEVEFLRSLVQNKS